MKKIYLSDQITIITSKDLIKVRSLIEKITGINDMKSSCRKVEYTAARAIMAYYCKSLGMSRPQIAPVIGRKESAVWNILKSHNNWVTRWKEYEIWFKRFKKSIE